MAMRLGLQLILSQHADNAMTYLLTSNSW